MKKPGIKNRNDGLLERWAHWWKCNRCLPLLLSLILFLIAYPYVERPEYATPLLVRLVTAMVLIAAVYAVSQRRRTLVIAIVLLLPAMTQNWTPDWQDQPYLTALELTASSLFFAFTTSCVLAYVLRGDEVTHDKVYGAICAYVLIGLTFAEVYRIHEVLEPGSFHVDTEQDPDGTLTVSDLTYYSLVTLTTLGYGDITPVTAKARSLAILEAVIGVMYIAILIARLMGRLRWQRDGPG